MKENEFRESLNVRQENLLLPGSQIALLYVKKLLNMVVHFTISGKS